MSGTISLALMSDPTREGLLGGYTSPPPPGAGGPPPLAAFGGPVAARYTLAGWWRRVGAHVIDGFVICAIALILLIGISAPFGVGFFVDGTVGIVAVIVGVLIACVCIFVAALLYAPAMMARTDGRTFGRMATGIRVVRASGEPMTFGFAMLREVAVKWLLFNAVGGSVTFGIAPLVDYLWPLWDEENRALHDYVVDTRTVLG
jgi:uncharacterized RDD family membrane protein YckC